MKIINILIFSILASFSFSQEYSQMPVVVQQKMDANKAAGIDLYDGVIATFDVDLSNLQESEVQAFKNQITADSRVKNFTLTADGTKLMLVSKGQYTIKDIKTYVVTTSAAIQNYSSVYSVED